MENETYMARALHLAQSGLGLVSPNPLVGCVIVHQNNIIGEGYHQKYGAAHAEVNAIRSVKEKNLLPYSTLYVTLEPCAHYGKTPPCADLIVKSEIKKVVICNLDPNPLVAGKGIQKLKEAGIDITLDVLHAQGKWLNRRFFTSFEKNRPYIILKWAETKDGFVDSIRDSNSTALKISDAINSNLVHTWRAQEDAIWVGKNTVLKDNPSLTTRNIVGKNPIRITCDKKNNIPTEFHIFNTEAKTIIFNIEKNEEKDANIWMRISDENCLEEMLNKLHQYKIQSILVKGGTWLLNTFIKSSIWDEARVSQHKDLAIGTGIKAPKTLNMNLKEKVLEGEMEVKFYTNPHQLT